MNTEEQIIKAYLNKKNKQLYARRIKKLLENDKKEEHNKYHNEKTKEYYHKNKEAISLKRKEKYRKMKEAKENIKEQ